LKKHSDEIVQKIINYYKQGKNPFWLHKNIEEFKNIKPSVMYNILNRNGIIKTKFPNESKLRMRKYDVDDNYFSCIDDEYKAYWLGFLMADGYVLTNKSTLGLSLSKKDVDHMEKLKKCIKSSSPINHYTSETTYGIIDYVRIHINSEKIKNDLEKLGFIENKTLILKYPLDIPVSLDKHFIRGYFDGDGSIISFMEKKRQKQQYGFKLCGTKEMLESIMDKIDNNKKFKLYRRHKNSETNNFYLSFGGNLLTYKYVKYLYEDANIYLERKYGRYLELKQLIENKKCRVNK